jgi:hypothetical protein
MSDIDIDLNKQLLSGKNTRDTKNSFRSAANEIISDKVREGRLPSQNQMSKRKTVLGVKPEGAGAKPLDNEKILSKRASIDDLINQQKEKNEILQKEIISPMNETNKNLTNMNYKQDVLTKQAIDEIKDNIEMFKMDINKYVNELREEQEKIELGDVKEEIKILEDTLTKDLKDTKEQNETDYRIIKESFLHFKEEVFQLITKIVKNNELKIEALYNEIKSYEEEVNKRFVQLSDRQEEYINTLKLILETTKDKTTKQLVKQFLVDDEDIYLSNKARFEKEFNERREKERQKLEEKEKQLLAVRLKAQEKQLEREEAEEGELQQLKQEAENREKNLMQRREEELIKKYEELQKRRDEEEYERQMKMEEDLLNYYNTKEREEYKKKLEFMKNQARINRKNKEKESPNQNQQQQQQPIIQEEKPQFINMKYPPNTEQSLQREKQSSESMSYVEKSSIKSKKRKSRKPKDKTESQNNEVKEEPKQEPEKESKKTKTKSKVPSKKSTKKEEEKKEEPPQEEVVDLKPEEIAAITNNETPEMLSLKQFAQLYTPGEYDFKKFVKNACKNSIINILKSQSFADVLKYNRRNELSSEGYTHTPSVTEQEGLNKSLNFTILQINQKIESIFEDLSNYISEDNISNEMQDFYKFISGNENFVPYSFYSLFELTRISTNKGYIKKFNDNQKKMIIGIYIVIKILVNYFMLDYNFLKKEDKSKVDEDTKINLKLISSIIYHQMITMIKSVCKIVTKIPNPVKKRNEQLNISRDIKVFTEKIEKNFLKGDPDTNENTIEYIELKLYRPTDFQKYTDGNTNSDFSLSKIIFNFINKFFNFMESS